MIHISDDQVTIAKACADAMVTGPCAGINTSETGTGKSAMALLTAGFLNRRLWCITPKVACSQLRNESEKWASEVLRITGNPLRFADVRNIEWLRYDSRPGWIKRVAKQFALELDPEQDMLLIDEAHTVTGDSLNANILRATNQLVKRGGVVTHYRVPVLLMSATLIDSPLRLRYALGERLQLFNANNNAQWLFSHGVSVRQIETRYGMRSFYEFKPPEDKRMQYLDQLNKELFPKFGGRLRKKDIPGFPESVLVPHVVDLGDKDLKRLEKAYQEHFEQLQRRKMEAVDVLPERVFARQLSELLKVPMFSDMTVNLLEEGNSVIVFLFYDATESALMQELTKRGIQYVVIRGGQSERERKNVIESFQSNAVTVCLCKIQAGGVGVELGDLCGRPRATILSPPDSCVLFTQAIGRAHRRNAVSGVTQYVLIANTKTELRIKRNLERKLENLEAIQDSDLIGATE